MGNIFDKLEYTKNSVDSIQNAIEENGNSLYGIGLHEYHKYIGGGESDIPKTSNNLVSFIGKDKINKVFINSAHHDIERPFTDFGVIDSFIPHTCHENTGVYYVPVFSNSIIYIPITDIIKNEELGGL